MCILLKLGYAQFCVSDLFFQKLSNINRWGGRLDPPPPVKRRVKTSFLKACCPMDVLGALNHCSCSNDHYYLTWSHGPGQVKECKIILEQSLLTGWLAGYRNRQHRFQFHQAKLGRTLERG